MLVLCPQIRCYVCDSQCVWRTPGGDHGDEGAGHSAQGLVQPSKRDRTVSVRWCPHGGECVRWCPHGGECVRWCPRGGECVTWCPHGGECVRWCSHGGECVRWCSLDGKHFQQDVCRLWSMLHSFVLRWVLEKILTCEDREEMLEKIHEYLSRGTLGYMYSSHCRVHT